MHQRMASAPDWDLYRSFLAVMEAGSLSAAARALGLAQPTVGRHIESLQAALKGEALFTRSPGGLRPTRTAMALAPHAKAMASAAEALVRAASGEAGGEGGVVRLTVSEVVGAHVLPGMLTAFREDHPRIDIELALSNRQEDLLRREADIAVRMARPTQNALFARRVGSVRLVMHAHRAYLQKHGEPRTLGDLRGHTLIGYDRGTLSTAVLASIDLEVTPALFALRADSELAQFALLGAGFGIGVCQRQIARRDPNLVAILKAAFGFELEMWVVMHEDLKGDRRVRGLFDHLVRGLKGYVDEDRAQRAP